MWTGSVSPLFTRSNQIMSHMVCKTYFKMGAPLTIKAGVFFKKMSHSVWQSSLIMSGPDDRTSMKAAVNGKMLFGKKVAYQLGSLWLCRKRGTGGKKTDETVLPPTALSIEVGGRMRGDG